METFATILSGVIVFVLGQLMMRFVIEPAADLKRELGSITNTFLERANGEHSVGLRSDDSSILLRQHAAKLMQGLWSIPMYHRVRIFFGLPPAEHIVQAARDLNVIARFIDELAENAKKQRADEVSYKIHGEIHDAIQSLADNLGIAVFLGSITRLLDPPEQS
ncbi:hypothetical protein [Kushneria phyllosphaerae]|uniref:Uncharacterized protein n=1 Tax=Kushneria phyllosphaerae TaxID=2100822 RepID=A0A2R8CKX9_9GAMM|nr:hypothetical protein [Kushneria phyllosphaerae]SPJ33434.1 hypothetical protein KSP9073_01443 [Kushneria phyllosphaerae]